MRRDDVKQVDDIFPAPPSTPRGVELRLTRRVKISAGGPHESAVEKMTYLGGLGPKSNPAEQASLGLVVQPMQKTWIPDNENENRTGKWKQETGFQSTFTLTCPPSFSTATMSIEVRTFSAPLILVTLTVAIRAVYVDAERPFLWHRQQRQHRDTHQSCFQHVARRIPP